MWHIFFKLDQIRNTAFGIITNRSAKGIQLFTGRYELKTDLIARTLQRNLHLWKQEHGV